MFSVSHFFQCGIRNNFQKICIETNYENFGLSSNAIKLFHGGSVNENSRN